MKNKLISFILILMLLAIIPLSATYKYNPYTRKLDYYERVADADLGDLEDVTLTGLASGDILYYNVVAWINLAKGSNGQYLSLSGDFPAWTTITSTFLGLTDTPSAYTGKAGQLVRVNAVPDGLEFFAGSAAGTVIVADGSGGWTKDANFNIVSGKVNLGGYEATAIANAYIAGAAGWDTKQPGDAGLTSLAALTYVSNSFIQMTAADTYVVRTLLDTAHDLEADIESVIDTLGNVNFTSVALSDGNPIQFGTGNDYYFIWSQNGTGDDLAVWYTGTMIGTNESAAFFISPIVPNNMTDHDNYLSPTFVIANNQAADANDYAGVVIGERTQASVLVAHYFDFYAMTGSADGSVDPNATELAAIFRFGASGSAVPGNATTPGDVLFEGAIEVDGDIYPHGDLRPGPPNLTIQTTAALANTYVQIKGTGGRGGLTVYDADGIHTLSMTIVATHGQIYTLGITPGELHFQGAVNTDIKCWSLIPSGNPWFYIYGNASGAKKYIRTSVDSNGDALIEPQNDLSILKGDGIYSLTVNFDDANPTTLCAVADGYVITDCWIEVTTAWDGNGYIEVGDGNDDDGFMDNTNYDDSTPGYYGFDENDRGDYLTNSLQYIYTGADTIDIKVNSGTSTQGIATVYVHITRLK